MTRRKRVLQVNLQKSGSPSLHDIASVVKQAHKEGISGDADFIVGQDPYFLQTTIRVVER